jgi:hypothetical protein
MATSRRAGMAMPPAAVAVRLTVPVTKVRRGLPPPSHVPCPAHREDATARGNVRPHREISMVPPRGLEQDSVTYDKDKYLRNRTTEGGAKSGANRAAVLSSDSGLEQVAAAWPNLPEPVKAGILAMVRASAGRETIASPRPGHCLSRSRCEGVSSGGPLTGRLREG